MAKALATWSGTVYSFAGLHEGEGDAFPFLGGLSGIVRMGDWRAGGVQCRHRGRIHALNVVRLFLAGHCWFLIA